MTAIWVADGPGTRGEVVGEGRDSMVRGGWSKAVGLLVLVLAVAPFDVALGQDAAQFDAHVGLARTLRDAGRVQDSADAFRAARALRPADTALRLEAFWVEVQADPVRGAALGLEILRDSPADGDVRDRLIGLAVESKDEARASALAREGERVDPTNPRWWRRSGESALRRGDATAAVSSFARVVASPQASDTDRAMHALALEAAAQPAEALAAWDRVSPAALASHPDWAASRLRASVSAAPLEDATRLVTRACPAAAGCGDLLGMLATRWQRAGRPGRGLELLQPLLDGPERLHWLRLATDLATAAGRTSLAVHYREELVASGQASARDVQALLKWHAETRSPADILGVARAANLSPCDPNVLDALAELPDAQPLVARVEAMPASCADRQGRRLQAADRLVATQEFTQALALLTPVATTPDATPATRERFGQLLAWTGDWPAAVRVLEPLVEAGGAATGTVDALVDAYRATGQPQKAWALVEAPRPGEPLTEARRVAWAEIGLDANDPRGAIALLAGTRGPLADGLRIRAHAALGEFDEAVAQCSHSERGRLTAPVALACVDAIDAMRGRAEARRFAHDYDAVPRALELDARRALWASLDGDLDEASALRARVAAASPERAHLLDAEIALQRDRPADALAALDMVRGEAWSARVLDLRSLAWFASGAHAEAMTALARLRQRAESPWLELRHREWAFASGRTPQELDALVALAGTSPLRVPAREAAARALLDAHEFERVKSVLVQVGTSMTIDGRLTLARALRATGAPAPALDLVRTAGLSRVADRAFRAELIGVVEGPGAGDVAFGELASAGLATLDTYLAWAQVVAGARRVEVLTAATARFPQSSSAWAELASSLALDGSARGALEAANRAIELDDRDLDTWLVALAATARVAPADLVGRVRDFEARFGDDRVSLIAAANRLGTAVHDASDPLGRQAVAWLDRSLGTPPDPQVRLARARLNATRREWDASLADLTAVLEAEAQSPDALKLRAEVLSYSGRHADAVRAYDAYLAVSPGDFAAARQQARVAAWGQDYEGAARRYEALLASRPADRALASEARAKRAFYAGRWDEAIAAYDEWLAIEPADGEAGFERAQALSQHGEATAARNAWTALMAQAPDHREAAAARRRFELAGRPAVRPLFSWQSADGYGGQRLLDVTESGADLVMPQGRGRQWTLLANLGAVEAQGGGERFHGGAGQAGASYRLHDELQLAARVGSYSLGHSDVTTLDALAAWSAGETWLLRTRVQRQPWLENATTVRDGLAATSWTLGAHGRWLDTTLDGAAGRRWLNDGNASWVAELTARQRLRRGRDEISAIAWTSWQAFERETSVYFSPSGFFRMDGGVEWRHWLSLPRFADDLARYVTASYQLGFDDRGTLYQHPTVRGGWEINDLLLLEAGADWIVSSVYHQTRATVQLRIGGPVRGN